MDIDLISLSSFSFPSENKLFVTLRVNGEIVDDARYDIGIYTKRRSKTTGMGDVAPITPLYLIMDGRGMDIRFPEAVVAYQNRGIEATRYGNEGEEIGGVEIEGIGTDTLIFSIPLEPFGNSWTGSDSSLAFFKENVSHIPGICNTISRFYFFWIS